MPLFRKSKEEGLKPLSEKDIQERLYGFFHQERAVQIAAPAKKVTKSVDLRSVEVTPAGILQSDLFRSDSSSQAISDEEEGNVTPPREFPNTIERNEISRSYDRDRSISQVKKNGSDFRMDEDASDVEESQPSISTVKKTVRKTVRKSTKKDRGNFETVKKFSSIVVSNLLSLSKTFFSWISRTFTAFVLWLSESRGESRRIPAKFVLVSFAVIGTGLIFFNLWSAHLKQNVMTPTTVATNYALNKKSLPKNQVVTKVIPANLDVISKVETSESQAPTPSKKYFSIQVCVAQSQEGAMSIVRKLKSGGLPAFYDSGTSKRGGKIYKIMLGKFEAYQTAKSQLETFKKTKVMEPYQDSFIRHLTPQR